MSDFLGVIADSVLSPFSTMATSWLTNSSRESLNKNITKTDLKYQKEYDKWTQEQDKAYEQWWQNYLYGLQNNEYFNLAKKYATNTASWAVQGLKKAGLNPILAAIDGNLSSNMGSAGPQQSGHKVGSGSVHGGSAPSVSAMHTNIASALASSSASQLSKAQTEGVKVDTGVKKATAASQVAKAAFDADVASATRQQVETSTAVNSAQADKISAEAQQVKAQTLQSLIRSYNDVRNHGQGSSFLGQLNNFIHDITPDTDVMRALSGSITRALGIDGDKKHSAVDLGNISVEDTAPWHESASRFFDRLRGKKHKDED